MEAGKIIRDLRIRSGMSQEDLAERIYVSRQTISSWENDKTYPDLQSLLLLSEVFNTAIDKIVGKDVQTMTKNIDREVKNLNRAAILMICFMLLMLASLAWLAAQILIWEWPLPQLVPTIILSVIFATASFIAAGWAEKIKKDNNLSTYREIAAFIKDKQPIDKD